MMNADRRRPVQAPARPLVAKCSAEFVVCRGRGRLAAADRQSNPGPNLGSYQRRDGGL